jgi:hypothetical protein
MSLSAKAKKLLEEFRETANAGDLHSYDEERWRAFVIQAHKDGGAIDDTEVSTVLREKWVEDVAVKLGGRYYDERRLLEDYDKR